MANFNCCGCRNELESRDAYPCNCCLRNEVLFADNYEEEATQREEGQDKPSCHTCGHDCAGVEDGPCRDYTPSAAQDTTTL